MIKMGINRINQMNLFSKLMDVLERNTDSIQIKIAYNNIDNYIEFKTPKFSLQDLYYIFHYWGFDYNDVLKNISFSSNNNSHILVRIWLKDMINPDHCFHEFIDRIDWKYKICKKCGLFKEL